MTQRRTGAHRTTVGPLVVRVCEAGGLQGDVADRGLLCAVSYALKPAHCPTSESRIFVAVIGSRAQQTHTSVWSPFVTCTLNSSPARVVVMRGQLLAHAAHEHGGQRAVPTHLQVLVLRLNRVASLVLVRWILWLLSPRSSGLRVVLQAGQAGSRSLAHLLVAHDLHVDLLVLELAGERQVGGASLVHKLPASGRVSHFLLCKA